MTQRRFTRDRAIGSPRSFDAADLANFSALPIIVGGCFRSGTSLVRRLLNAHSRIFCGPDSLGPSGIAKACRISGARYFLPCAHGFLGIGKDPASREGGSIYETTIASHVRKALSRIGCATEVVDWRPGDVARFVDKKLSIGRAVR